MRKQFLYNSTDFPNQLNCSSIRINAQQEEQHNYRKDQKKNKMLSVDPKGRKFQQNDIVGFQMSLQISQNGSKCLQLMRSKSARDYKKPNQQKIQIHKKQKQHIALANSLYNTTSFDEMTMNITTNTKNANITNQQIHIQQTYQQQSIQKTLKKPIELSKFKQTIFNQKNIMNNNNNLKVQFKQKDDKKTQNLLIQAMKCSGSVNGEEQAKSYQQISYQQPYFNVASNLHNIPKIQPQQNKLFVQIHRRGQNKITSPQAAKSNQKKLTLRDYMYLSKLSGKNRGRCIQQQLATPKFTRSPQMATSRSRRKIIANNPQIMFRLKRQVIQNIQLIQGNMNLILEYINNMKINEDIQNNELMNMYTMARIIRQKMISGNDQLVRLLQNQSKLQ